MISGNGLNHNMNNLQLYINLLSSSLYLDNLTDNNDEDNYSYSIPISLISEENIAHKFTENIKASIRSSIEYKQWVKWFKERYSPVICSVSDNTTTIEVHHHPLTLEDYVDIALAFIYNNNLVYTSHLIADMVMRWHYANMVGACFMSKTYHMRFHENHDISIPEECIHWDIIKFLNDPIISQYSNEYINEKIVTYMPRFAKENSSYFNKLDNIFKKEL